MSTPIDPQAYWSHGLRVKICGITNVEQGSAISTLGAHALGFICVPSSPRYITPAQIGTITQQLPTHTSQGIPFARIGVFANTPIELIQQTVSTGRLTGIQLHGQESPSYCQQLRAIVPGIEIIKAFRIRSPQILQDIPPYLTHINALLLDAYTPQALGGTGSTWDWAIVKDFAPSCPWFLAGGLTPDNINQALQQTQPNGIDLSSGLEKAPGDKDLEKIKRLFQHL